MVNSSNTVSEWEMRRLRKAAYVSMCVTIAWWIIICAVSHRLIWYW